MIFNANEVFEIARKIEVNGAAFYQKAASVVKDPGAKKLLELLAEMEQAHEGTFGGLQDALTKAFEAADSGNPDFDQQALSHIQAMADGQVFDADAAPLAKLKGGESAKDILEIAISFEKNSIVFFSSIKSLVPEDLGKDTVDALVNEEIGHAAILCKELARLKK